MADFVTNFIFILERKKTHKISARRGKNSKNGGCLFDFMDFVMEINVYCAHVVKVCGHTRVSPVKCMSTHV